MPERHLGLVTADEAGPGKPVTDQLISMVEKHLDLDALMERLAILSHDGAGPDSVSKTGRDTLFADLKPVAGKGPVIGVARDKAFCFYYPDNLEMLEFLGARLHYFSPLDSDCLPEGLDGLYFGGGYPELFARELARKKDLLAQVKQAGRRGMPIYGECGGFMFLCQSITDPEGTCHAMAGCFDFKATMSSQLKALGYRQVSLADNSVIGPGGLVLKGHEFHYSSLDSPAPSGRTVYRVFNRSGQDINLKGYAREQTLGSYFHLHFGSNPEAARHFVLSCQAFARKNG